MYTEELNTIEYSYEPDVVTNQSLAGDFIFKNDWFVHDCLRVSVLLIKKHNAIVFLISATWSIQLVYVGVESLCSCCAQAST